MINIPNMLSRVGGAKSSVPSAHLGTVVSITPTIALVASMAGKDKKTRKEKRKKKKRTTILTTVGRYLRETKMTHPNPRCSRDAVTSNHLVLGRGMGVEEPIVNVEASFT